MGNCVTPLREAEIGKIWIGTLAATNGRQPETVFGTKRRRHMTIAIITGGSRGLGRSAALQCAARGSGIILTYNSHPEEADKLVRAIEASGGRAVALKLDVAGTLSFRGKKPKAAFAAALAATGTRPTPTTSSTMPATDFSSRSLASPKPSSTACSRFSSRGHSS